MPSYPAKRRYYYANLSAEKGSTENKGKKKNKQRGVAYRLRASSYEPGNRAGSVTGTNSVVCSYGKFSPVDLDEFKKHNQNGGR